ncbi:hypothetical protein PR202_gb07588 [Eleusine coracana subsp. coracana]|uniref:Uncharacterized protein n=1 Tax=Eleusine coracana subsp. coracana TaxID=191504 RepID=A0AAV5EDG5_ELECO|nr:hypothetical protein PR202_gb07588 [Eleusine coracana subsp. coracana]
MEGRMAWGGDRPLHRERREEGEVTVAVSSTRFLRRVGSGSSRRNFGLARVRLTEEEESVAQRCSGHDGGCSRRRRRAQRDAAATVAAGLRLEARERRRRSGERRPRIRVGEESRASGGCKSVGPTCRRG